MLASPITISWTAPTSTNGESGFNVYLRAGVEQAKTWLAFVPLSTLTYTYSPVTEDTQYQFEVRAATASYPNGTESLPLEIVYPTGTSLWTPTTLTPSGNPQMLPRDAQYLGKDDFLNYASGLKLTTSSPLYTSGVLDVYLQMASEEVNRYCHRHFQRQTIDEIHYDTPIGQSEPKLVTLFLNEAPIQSINRVDIQVLKWFINFSLSYLQLDQETGMIKLVPFLGGGASGIPLPSAALVAGLLGHIWVNYTCGYDVIPNAVKIATGIFATKIIGLQENPVSAQQVRFGRNFQLAWDRDNDPLIEQAKRILEPYVRHTWRRP